MVRSLEFDEGEGLLLRRAEADGATLELKMFQLNTDRRVLEIEDAFFVLQMRKNACKRAAEELDIRLLGRPELEEVLCPLCGGEAGEDGVELAGLTAFGVQPHGLLPDRDGDEPVRIGEAEFALALFEIRLAVFGTEDLRSPAVSFEDFLEDLLEEPLSPFRRVVNDHGMIIARVRQFVKAWLPTDRPRVILRTREGRKNGPRLPPAGEAVALSLRD